MNAVGKKKNPRISDVLFITLVSYILCLVASKRKQPAKFFKSQKHKMRNLTHSANFRQISSNVVKSVSNNSYSIVTKDSS